MNNHEPEADTRDVLLTAARALMAEDANFSVKTLLTRANVTRAQFRRHFAGKTELLSALAGQDVKELGDILQAVLPVRQSLRKVVGAAPVETQATAPVPVADQWLERRLRVFERALAAMEKRQEQSEQNLVQAIARLNEKLDMAAAPVMAQEPAPMAEPVVMASPIAVPEPEPVAPQEAPQEFSPAVIAHVEEIAGAAVEEKAETPAISEQEMQDFIAHARTVASNAAVSAEAAPSLVRKPPWLAWGGAAAVLLLLLTVGLLITGGAFGHNRPVAGNGVVHRQFAQTGVPRMLALADNGNAAAQTKLALAYLRGGNGVAEDEKAALRWAKAAAGQGQPVAQYLLGTLFLESDQVQAVRWFKASAVQGNVKAMHNLAIAYAEGLGTPKNPAEAVIWFARAAGQGYGDSQFDLAVMYERGEGVPQDAVAALTWYRIAAAAGDMPSSARGQFLMTQMNAADVNAAMDEAAAFVAKPVAVQANEGISQG